MRRRLAAVIRRFADRLELGADENFHFLAKHVPEEAYVGFIDLLGFSHRVEHEFEATLELYDELTGELRRTGLSGFSGVRMNVVSDSILFSGPSLPNIVRAVNLCWPTITRYEFLARGGIASGLHVEATALNNHYLVSQALVQAVRQEKAIKHPCVALCDLVPPPAAFVPYHSNIERPLLWYENAWIVNPLSLFWGTSAVGHAEDLLRRYPEHRAKYEWFIRLGNAVLGGERLIPTEEEYGEMLAGRAATAR